jgi:hypothetical protein
MALKNLLAKTKENYAALKQRWLAKRFASLFNRVADEKMVLPPEDLLCLQVAWYVYYPVAQRPKTLESYTLEDLDTDNERVCMYLNHAEKHLIVGYRGTEATDTKDIASDAQIILGVSGVDKRVKSSLRIYDSIQAKYPDYRKWVCGHSLGGTIAYIIAKHRNPARVTVFNPGSAPNTLFIQMLTDTMKKAGWTKNVYTYKILGDVISAFSFVGHSKVFRVNLNEPISLHRMPSFLGSGVQIIPLGKNGKEEKKE